jgi:mannose-1-phosphate guanylyltransferase
MDLRPFILAGGSGTRFWPRSRRKHPKQVLSLDSSDKTMLQQTLERLLPVAPASKCWVMANEGLLPTIAAQLDQIPQAHLLAEPVARNTAPAAGLAAFLLEREAPYAVLGLFPADHAIENTEQFRQILHQASALAEAGPNIIVLGIHPSRPETGYGYIETGEVLESGAVRVRRFTEKPNRVRAEEFLATGRYFWNSGMFLAMARTLADAFREHLPETSPYLEEIAAAYGTDAFAARFAELYPKCEDISIDYAILEPRSAKGEHRSNLYCIPAEFGWNDLGSWSALYDHKLARDTNPGESRNVIEAPAHSLLDAAGNYAHVPQRHVALVGVQDLVIVETDDVLLVTTRSQCQDVGKLVKQLLLEQKHDLV